MGIAQRQPVAFEQRTLVDLIEVPGIAAPLRAAIVGRRPLKVK